MKNKYLEFAKFINTAQERAFNDSLMRLIIKEIELKSGNLNLDMILPRYYNKSCIDVDGVEYQQSGIIKDMLGKVKSNQALELVKEGCKLDFKTRAGIMTWINDVTGIKFCSLASLWS